LDAGFIHILGVFEELLKASISFAIRVRPSAWNNSAPTGQFAVKFGIYKFVEHLSRKFKLD
jgi:hypothetical protein